jgi:NNP family nitrate/nitrite transporter-like MFS transporter
MDIQIPKSTSYRALFAATLAFAANFSVWVLYAVLGIELQTQLNLSATELGLLLSSPMLTGALLRLPVGMLCESVSAKKVFIWQMLLLLPALFMLRYASSYQSFLLIGLLLGISGVSFTIGIRYIVDWFESKHQGAAMGVFGAGNAGAAITLILAPYLIEHFGLEHLGTFYAFGVILTILLFGFIAPSPPQHIQLKPKQELFKQLQPLKQLRVWQFGLYYYFVFGSFLALTLWLPHYYVNAYKLNMSQAMALTLLFVASSSLVRAAGGWLSDRYGAKSVNWMVFWVCLVCLFFLSYPPTSMVIEGVERDVTIHIKVNVWLFTALVFVIGIAQGFGRASVYKAIYDVYPTNMGSVGGAVAMVGALGGCTLPLLFGLVVDWVGVYSACFMLLYGVLALCMLLMYFTNQKEKHRQRVQHAIETNFLER